ncbi:MAG: Trm112 family protein [Candidatus Acidiferrales bacterium]
MALDAELLKILVCPQCKTRVELTPDQQGLRCPACRVVYPIRDDIPIMLVDEARPES